MNYLNFLLGHADANMLMWFFFSSLVCKIRSGATDLSKAVNVTVEVREGEGGMKVEGRYAIDGKAEMPGFTFLVPSTPLLESTYAFRIFPVLTAEALCRYPTSLRSSPTMGLASGAR